MQHKIVHGKSMIRQDVYQQVRGVVLGIYLWILKSLDTLETAISVTSVGIKSILWVKTSLLPHPDRMVLSIRYGIIFLSTSLLPLVFYESKCLNSIIKAPTLRSNI